MKTMSLEFEDIVIKEEYMVGESDEDSNKVLSTDESRTKCGEVFFNNSGLNFTFVCTRCLQLFSTLCNFGEHIKNVHLLLKEENLAADTQEDNKQPPKSELPLEAGADFELQNSEEGGDNESHVRKELELKEDNPLLEPTTRKKKTKPVKRKRSKTLCCFSCGRLFVACLSYRRHYQVEHPDMIEKDDNIGTELRKKYGFVPKVPSEMLCKFCLKTFHEPTTYHAHIEFDHTDKLYSCPQCPMTFKQPNQRDYHTDVHDGKKRFQCPHCPTAFTHPNNLRTHINIHLNNKKYSCRFCDKKYVHISDMRIHERIHTNEKPYQCDECGMSFVAQAQLTNHKRRHKNIKNHKCLHCDKAFFSSTMLKNHIRTHTRETPFSCDTCHRKFRTSSALRSHEHLHSDVKQYACKVCEKAFAQHAGLYSHMKSHHRI